MGVSVAGIDPDEVADAVPEIVCDKVPVCVVLGVVVMLRVCVGCAVGDRVPVPEGATVSVPDTLDVVLGVIVTVPVPV